MKSIIVIAAFLMASVTASAHCPGNYDKNANTAASDARQVIKTITGSDSGTAN